MICIDNEECIIEDYVDFIFNYKGDKILEQKYNTSIPFNIKFSFSNKSQLKNIKDILNIINSSIISLFEIDKINNKIQYYNLSWDVASLYIGKINKSNYVNIFIIYPFLLLDKFSIMILKNNLNNRLNIKFNISDSKLHIPIGLDNNKCEWKPYELYSNNLYNLDIDEIINLDIISYINKEFDINLLTDKQKHLMLNLNGFFNIITSKKEELIDENINKFEFKDKEIIKFEKYLQLFCKYPIKKKNFSELVTIIRTIINVYKSKKFKESYENFKLLNKKYNIVDKDYNHKIYNYEDLNLKEIYKTLYKKKNFNYYDYKTIRYLYKKKYRKEYEESLMINTIKKIKSINIYNRALGNCDVGEVIKP